MLPGVSRGGSAASDLRALLVDVISDLAASGAPRDAEATPAYLVDARARAAYPLARRWIPPLHRDCTNPPRSSGSPG